ncbi:MAG: hypothetical protein ACJ8C4_05560 [Gemmataceae bacterium]
MSWTLNGVTFKFRGEATALTTSGDAAAWICPSCGTPVVFIYAPKRAGSHPSAKTSCPGCQTQYFLTPPVGFLPDPAMARMPASTMTIEEFASRLQPPEEQDSDAQA